MSFIESGHSGIVMDKIRRGLTTSHIGFVYEDICQERMWELGDVSKYRKSAALDDIRKALDDAVEIYTRKYAESVKSDLAEEE